ncbi:CaiB/BaiF CoA transferase family protein [Amycolatopsis sp. NPDC051903]|uniref:CaiB/BaiF CoA transferase family protein n=1 Tax=Amycolatopsis sp. NPDC051903 TaxID=3363936 RepID=UPI00379C3F36
MLGSLTGVRVVDLTMSVAGPFATQILGDLGAEVLKIERPPAGDDTRRWGPPFWGEDSATFHGLNRNKRSLLVDLKSAEGKEALSGLLAGADILVQNLRPGTLEKLGFGWAELHLAHPELIYCEITGYGPTGPLAGRPAYDPLMQAFGGLMSLTGEEGRSPTRIPASILDQGSGMWLVIGILDALRRRDRTGEGSLVQTSLLETALMWLPGQFTGYFAEGEVPRRLGSGTVGIAPYEAFPAADGWLIVAAGNDNLWHKLCGAINRRDLLDDPRFTGNPDRVANRVALSEELSRTFRARESRHWIETLTEAAVPVTPIQTLDEVAAHEHVRALGAFREVAHPGIEGYRSVATPIRVDGEYYPVRRVPPAPGEANAELLDGQRGKEQADV